MRFLGRWLRRGHRCQGKEGGVGKKGLTGRTGPGQTGFFCVSLAISPSLGSKSLLICPSSLDPLTLCLSPWVPLSWPTAGDRGPWLASWLGSELRHHPPPQTRYLCWRPVAGHIAPGEGRGRGHTVVRFLGPHQQRVRRRTGRCVWVTRVVSAHTHADVALGEGNRLGGLWSTAGLEPEFPLWLGLISLPLAFVGDPRWFLPSLGSGPLRRARPQAVLGGRCWGKGRLHGAQACPGTSDAHWLSSPSAPRSGNWRSTCSPR